MVFANFKTLEIHLQGIHNLSSKEYYIKHSNQARCNICQIKTEFCNLEFGFYKYCKEHANSNDYNICKICGEPRETTRSFQFHINDHIKRGDIKSTEEYYLSHLGKQAYCLCGSPIKFSGYLIRPYSEHCSTGCASRSSRESIAEKLFAERGVRNVANLPETTEKKIKTCQERYEKDNPFQVDEFKEKSEQTKQERFGDDYKKVISILQQESMLKSYGVKSPAQVVDIKNQMVATYNLNYPIGSEKRDDVVRRRSLGLKKFWATNLVQITKDRRSKFYTRLQEFCRKHEYSFSLSKEEYVNCTNINITCNVCKQQYSEKLPETISVVYPRCPTCYPVYKSTLERDILRWFTTLVNPADLILNSKHLLGERKELDIYHQTLKVALEANGTYWHSDKFCDELYHIKKTKLGLEQGIRVYQITENDWWHKMDVTKSLITQRLFKEYEKVDCIIGNIEDDRLRKFVDKNSLLNFETDYDMPFSILKDGTVIAVGSFKITYDDLTLNNFCMNHRFQSYDVVDTIVVFAKALGCFKNLFVNEPIAMCPDYRDSLFLKHNFEYVGATNPQVIIIDRFGFVEHAKVGSVQTYDCGNHKFSLILK